MTATSQATDLARSTKTDNTGHYLIPLLPVGTYTFHVEGSGFRAAELKDLVLQVDQARELDFTLSPSSVVTQVTVSGEAVAVETANPSLGQVITSQQVADLPLNGRDFVQWPRSLRAQPRRLIPAAFSPRAATARLQRAVRTLFRGWFQA